MPTFDVKSQRLLDFAVHGVLDNHRTGDNRQSPVIEHYMMVWAENDDIARDVWRIAAGGVQSDKSNHFSAGAAVL